MDLLCPCVLTEPCAARRSSEVHTYSPRYQQHDTQHVSTDNATSSQRDLDLHSHDDDGGSGAGVLAGQVRGRYGRRYEPAPDTVVIVERPASGSERTQSHDREVAPPTMTSRGAARQSAGVLLVTAVGLLVRTTASCLCRYYAVTAAVH